MNRKTMKLPELNCLPRDSCGLKMRRKKAGGGGGRGETKRQRKYANLPNDHDS